MAKIRIVGDSSGYVELAAPNAAGNNTLELPASGTKLVGADANGAITVGTGASVSSPATNVLTLGTNNSERVRIGSTGSVGIGTNESYGDSNASFTSLSLGGNGTRYGLIELNKSDGIAGSWIDCYGTGGNGDLRITTAGTSGAITFWTGGEFTEKVRINSSGNLGIGTTNPQARLHIHGGDAYLSFDKGLYFARENGNTEWSNYIKSANNPDGGYSSTTANNYWVEIGSFGGTHIVLNMDGARDAGRNVHDHFTIWQKDSDSTNGARLFAVDNYGQVQFGYAGIRIDRGWDNYACITVQRDNTWGTSNASQAEFRIHGTSQTHAEWVGGASGADFSTNLRIDGATYSSSDKRHKTNIVDNPYGLNQILQLQPRKFNRINSSGEIEENQGDILGFIAQEVKEVIPEAVNYYPDEDIPNEIGWCRAYSLSDGYIVSTLVNAVKEQNAIIESLKSRIEVLESQINT